MILFVDPILRRTVLHFHEIEHDGSGRFDVDFDDEGKISHFSRWLWTKGCLGYDQWREHLAIYLDRIRE